ncbi:MAG: phenylalanine--tRNA ligase subunit beta [Kiritimatiellae bacterium]|nr:phenylalanine--tRNA ligase subunit beta [Kiritimatiellia bacterium]
MKVPLSWLREYIDMDEPASRVAERLTFSGIEVEGIETFGADLSGMVAAEIRSVERHPNADRLTVCRVFDGTAECQVVCGAPNARAGTVVPFAPAGVTLPGGTRIKASKLRGVESHGMLCAEDELGLSDDHSGLMILDASVAPGTPLNDIFGGPDTVLDLEITPNRPDCLGIIGIARELSALYGRPWKRPDTEMETSGPKAETFASVSVEDAADCPRYSARILNNLTLAPSPRWMQQRLAAAGTRPINNIVDITNYVMIECGQPLHAFDLQLLRGARIVVRRARAGEQIVTLDGQTRALAESMLMITDAGGPVAVAGVMGGQGSEIRAETASVLLESASFHRGLVRAASKTLGLSTESSYRFARGVDPEGVDWASRRAAHLMQRLAGATVAPGVLDIYPNPPAVRVIRARPERIAALLGAPAPAAEIASVLRSLEIPAQVEPDGTLTAEAPSFRSDLDGEADLAEEFARIRGLDMIPANAPAARIAPDADDTPVRARHALHDALTGLGLTEIMNYSLTSDRLFDRFGGSDREHRIRLPHPLSEEQSMLRTSLVPQLVETLERNRAHQVGECALFELGRVYRREGASGHSEEERVAIGLMGAVGRPPLGKRPDVTPAESLSWLRGILDALARALRAGPVEYAATEREAFEPGWALELRIHGTPAGCAGVLRRDRAAEGRIYEPVAVAELRADVWGARAFDRTSPQPPPAFPSSTRDIAFFCPSSVRHEQVLRALRKAIPGPELERVELFDIFEGKAAGPGRKSMAYSLTFRSPRRTLKDEEVMRFQESAARALVSELGAEIRDA